jgi:hypothetical protein
VHDRDGESPDGVDEEMLTWAKPMLHSSSTRVLRGGKAAAGEDAVEDVFRDADAAERQHLEVREVKRGGGGGEDAGADPEDAQRASEAERRRRRRRQGRFN